MKLNRKAVIIFILIFASAGCLCAQDVPEEARKHLIRGQTAVEMAKQPSDYNLAILEFNQAIELAPGWDEPHYQLGLVYEKTGQYNDAIASLKKFIELSKIPAMQTQVQDLIYKLEFKAEQMLTNEAIVDILCANFLEWEKVGGPVYWPFYYMGAFTKTGENTVKISHTTMANDGGIFTRVEAELTITGPTVTFNSFVDQCSDDPCPYTIINELEFISRTEVIYRQTLIPIEPNSESHKKETLTITLKKK